jgi:hypothetical protein
VAVIQRRSKQGLRHIAELMDETVERLHEVPQKASRHDRKADGPATYLFDEAYRQKDFLEKMFADVSVASAPSSRPSPNTSAPFCNGLLPT